MSSALWTAADIATATGGRASGSWSVAGVSIDSRTVTPGELFIALRGPHHDGHDFVRAALERGAAALVDRIPTGVLATAPLVEVEDSMAALTALGRAGRNRSPARIAAITGSVGKTGSKEALRQALAGQGTTHASSASFNNHWGVPLSLARLPRSAVYGIFELGMNAPGEIGALARLVRPQVALITAIAPAHLGAFDSVEAIAAAKGEIFQGLQPGGIAVLNADDSHFAMLRAMAMAADCGRVVGFGAAPAASAQLLEARLLPDGSEVTMQLDGERLRYRIGAPGRHWVQNSLGVIATAAALGADPTRAAAALAEFRPPAGRGARHQLACQGGAALLIDESYNANPASVQAALELLAAAAGRKVLALGDMLELGPRSAELHAALAEPIGTLGIDRVFTAGPAMRHLHAALPMRLRGVHVEQAAELIPILASELRAGDTLLIKGSLGSRMGQIVEALLAGRGPARAARAGGG
jgi:UDP-N-acetylmuramoyl-tripeptide--D-alanyl-D-alanine ligase